MRAVYDFDALLIFKIYGNDAVLISVVYAKYMARLLSHYGLYAGSIFTIYAAIACSRCAIQTPDTEVMDIQVRQTMTEPKTTLVLLDDAGLAQTIESLRQLPRKGRPLREVIAYLQGEIRQTLAKGYSYPELVALLGERGIAIAEPTLRQYLAATQPAKPAKDPAVKPKTSPEHQSHTPNTSKRRTSDQPDISKKGRSDARDISKKCGSDAQDISKKCRSDAPHILEKCESDPPDIWTRQSSDTQSRRPIGRFVEMPDEL